MSRIVLLGFLGCLALSPISSLQGGDNIPVRTDDEFLQMAATGHNAAIHIGKIAEVRAKNDMVKDFSQRLVREHQAAYENLGTMFKTRKLGVVVGLEKEYRDVAKRLVEVNADEFDREFLSVIQKHHDKCITNYESHIKSSRKSDVRDYAEKAVKVLREHRDLAKKLQTAANQ